MNQGNVKLTVDELDFSRCKVSVEGGTAPVYTIKGECNLTFKTTKGEGFVKSRPNFHVTKVAIDEEKTRVLVFNLIPSLIGMDILEDFKLVATKTSAYLEL